MGNGVSGSQFELFVLAVRDKYAQDDFAPDIRDEAWKIGRLKGMGQAAAPSVKFFRPSGTMQATDRPGPHEITLDDGSLAFFSSVYEDLANVEVRIHAQSWLEMECIQTGLLSAARVVMGQFSVPGGYDHVSEGDEDPMPEFVKGNQLMIQTFVWTILVPQTVGSMTTIEKILGTSQFININDPPGSAGPATEQPIPP